MATAGCAGRHRPSERYIFRMPERNASIAILHYTAPPIVGGVESIIFEHARLLNEAGYPPRLVVGRGGDGGLPAGQPVTLIPEIDTGSHVHPELAEALNRGELLPEFESWRDRIAAALAEALAGVDVLIAHNVMTMHFNLPLTAALHKLRVAQFISWRAVRQRYMEPLINRLAKHPAPTRRRR